MQTSLYHISLILLFFSGLYIAPQETWAQALTAPTEVRLLIEGQDHGRGNPFGATMVDSTALNQTGIAFVHLPPLDSSRQVLIKLGRTQGGNECFDGLFSLHSTKPLPEGQSLRKVGDKLVIRLGRFSLQQLQPGPLYLQVMLGDGKGRLSKATVFEYQ